jgi:hypothetical protein
VMIFSWYTRCIINNQRQKSVEVKCG